MNDGTRDELEEAYEYGLPEGLQNDLDAYKAALAADPKSIDIPFLWCELYGSINVALINEGSITEDHAQYLRNKYLWR